MNYYMNYYMYYYMSYYMNCFILLFIAFQEEPTKRDYFSDIIDSISDVKFSHCGRYILSRDYMALKVKILTT